MLAPALAVFLAVVIPNAALCCCSSLLQAFAEFATREDALKV